MPACGHTILRFFVYCLNMALTGTLEVPPELRELFDKLMRPVEKRRYSAIATKGHLLSPVKRRNIATRSLLPEISAIWAGLTPLQQQEWKSAAGQSGYNGWNLFVQDTAYRLKYGLPGIADPSLYHQYKVGKIEIGGTASRVVLEQYHPNVFYKMKKVRGTKAQYVPVKITEQLMLPLEIGLSYKTELTDYGGTGSAQFYAKVKSHFQGRDIETRVGFDIRDATGWTRETALITEILGTPRSYSLVIELDNVQGTVLFDNVLARHTGTNFARDYRCNDVNNNLTKINYMIESSWEEQFLPLGAAFDSVYPPD